MSEKTFDPVCQPPAQAITFVFLDFSAVNFLKLSKEIFAWILSLCQFIQIHLDH